MASADVSRSPTLPPRCLLAVLALAVNDPRGHAGNYLFDHRRDTHWRGYDGLPLTNRRASVIEQVTGDVNRSPWRESRCLPHPVSQTARWSCA
jgi:hypothetical protein